MTFKAMIFTIAALIPSIGFADTISLSIPYEAASLHDGDVDMVVYYVDHPDHFEVVATYVSKTDLTTANLKRLELTTRSALFPKVRRPTSLNGRRRWHRDMQGM